MNITNLTVRMRFTDQQLRWEGTPNGVSMPSSVDRLERFVWKDSEQRRAFLSIGGEERAGWVQDFNFAEGWCVIHARCEGIPEDDLIWFKLKFPGVTLSHIPLWPR